MMPHPPRLLAPLALTLLCGLCWPVAAQEEGEKTSRWFRVELLVFARTGEDPSGEQWPRDVRLRYPLDWVTLKPSVSNPESTGQSGPPPALAMARLPEDERDMNRYARAMTDSGDYRILFHQAWRQPVKEGDEAPWLLVSGGERFGRHHELEGSVRLSVSRYLHLRTRLWLTRFEPNYGQPPGAWPELPRHPDTPLAEPATERSPAPTDADWDEDWRDPEPDSAWDTRLNTTSNLPEFMDEEYVPERIVTMNQQRRMRSEELHYLDHPLMGLLIRIEPWEEPEEKETEGNSASD